MDELQADFCVVGAGYAGLAAARRLRQAGSSIVVLEARDRVGGRVWTVELPGGTRVDVGGTWFGPNQTRVAELAREFGIGTYDTYVDGDNLLLRGGKTYRYRGPIPFALDALFGIASLYVAIKRLDWMAKQVPLEAPWRARSARDWDSQTVATWINSPLNMPSGTGYKLLRTPLVEFFTSDPAETSLLHLLFLIHSNDRLENLVSLRGGVQQSLVAGGMQSMANRIAGELGDAVHLGAPVRQVTQDADGVEVVADTAVVRARRAIVAVPPTLAGQLRYAPPLPRDRMLLTQRVPMGSVIRFVVVYDEPFWRAEGFSGVSLDLGSPMGPTIDASPVGGRPGMLSTYMFGPHARQGARLEPTERRRLVLNALTKRFGPKAADPTEYVEQDWVAEEWTRGGMMGHFPPGVLTGFGPALRAPVGRIHWACTETATAHHGMIEGAIRSGERAADEVLAAG